MVFQANPERLENLELVHSEWIKIKLDFNFEKS